MLNQSTSVLKSRLVAANRAGLTRKPLLPRGIDFCSNDYLGFANDLDLRRLVLRKARRLPLGSRGSRLLSGHSAFLNDIEDQLARFSGQRSALLYPSGYQANVGLLSALLRPGDIVYSDELNHASIIDGIRLSHAEKRIYKHGDASHLKTLLEQDSKKSAELRLVVTESIFSMDGDLTPLAEIVQLSKKHNASIVVDEAHATGIFGAGLVQRDHLHHDVLATIHTGGKALGVSGAWIAGADSLKDYLIQFSRSQIFSTALSPWIAAALGSAVEYWYKVGPDRAERVLENMRTISNQLNGSSPIFPFVCGSSEHALHTATRMQQLGLDVRAVRFPTVPEDQARLRITCPWGRSKDEIKRLKTALNEVWHG